MGTDFVEQVYQQSLEIEFTDAKHELRRSSSCGFWSTMELIANSSMNELVLVIPFWIITELDKYAPQYQSVNCSENLLESQRSRAGFHCPWFASGQRPLRGLAKPSQTSSSALSNHALSALFSFAWPVALRIWKRSTSNLRIG